MSVTTAGTSKEQDMSYVDGFVAAVPKANKEEYLRHARASAKMFKEYGATKCVETWSDDVSEGKQTDFYRAVQAKPDEAIVFSWIRWPDKATRDAAWAKTMEDARMKDMQMPFDGKRMIYGGFSSIFEG
jgi:uncharacterized protein YbaA (DUF1428 family)